MNAANIDAMRDSNNENCAETVFEDPVVKILRGFQDVPDKTIKKMKELEVTFKDISALNEEDLTLFGVENKLSRAGILSKLANCPNQDVSFDGYYSDLNKEQFAETVYVNVRDHLKRIDLVLKTSQYLHRTDPINFDMLMDDNVYFSTLNVKLLDGIKDEIESELGNIKSNNKKCWLFSMVGLALIGTIIAFR